MNRRDYNRNFERYGQNREYGRQGRRGGYDQGSGGYGNRGGYGNQGYYGGTSPEYYGEGDYGDYYDNNRSFGGGEYGNEGNSGRYGRDSETGYRGSRYGEGGYQNSNYSDSDYSSGNYSTRSYNRNEDRDYGRGNYGTRGRDDRGWWDRVSDEVSSWFEGDEGDEYRRDEYGRNRSSYRGRGPKNYTRSDDRIREDVNDRLSDSYYLDASDIEVKVENGEVTLDGTVQNRQSKRMAEDLAEEVSGVKHVQNNLRVQSYQSGSRGSYQSGTQTNMSQDYSTPTVSPGLTGTSGATGTTGAAGTAGTTGTTPSTSLTGTTTDTSAELTTGKGSTRGRSAGR
jgi:osmotically-inducible protein OsmY